MANITEYQTVILAALLHDIGKLLGRGQFKVLDKGQHPKFSSDFISSYRDFFGQVADADLLKELVQKHHENKSAFPPEYLVQSITDDHRRTLAKLVSLADNLSSSERGKSSDKYQDYKSTALCSVMERVDNTETEELKLRFHPLPLPSTSDATANTAIFPSGSAEYAPGEMNKLITSFGEEFAVFVKNSGGMNTFELVSSHLANMLYTHTWCIPSNTQEKIPDVSLYDHLKLTAAIAACLYRYHVGTSTLTEKELVNPDTARFLIAGGDISGIQNYIFDIADSTVGGVAKMLRARSLFIQVCTEIVAHRILHSLDLPLLNVIMNSGGNFYLLLPNIPEAVQVLPKIQGEIDQWFITHLNGELSLNLAWHPFSDTGFKAEIKSSRDEDSGFSKILQAVQAKLNQRKGNKFKEITQPDGKWQEKAFVIPLSFNDKEACPSCHKYPVEAGVTVCADCDRIGQLGSALPRAKYISFFRDETSGSLPVLNYSATVSSQAVRTGKPYLVMKLNDPDTQDIISHPAAFKYLANHVPQKEGQTLSFKEIAEKSAGQNLLGILKADVDRLGEHFVFGLKSDKASWDTISRLTTLSRQMDLYFTGWLQSLISNQFPECYTVFSGGDDVFIVGPWDRIVALSAKINSDFARFSGNPDITLSAGIVIIKPGYPLARAAHDVEEALKEAKSGGRDRITLLEKTLTWDELNGVIREWEQLKPAVADSAVVPTTLFQNLLAYGEMWQHYKKGNISGLRYHPLLSYAITRNINPGRAPGFYEWITKLLKWPPGDAEKTLDNLGIITKLCLFMRRGGK